MATGKFYIRPSADISLEHPVYPDTLGAGYLAINEEVSDGTATYIGLTSNPNSDLEWSSSFKMSLFGDKEITKVISATLRYDGEVDRGARLSANWIYFYISDEEVWYSYHNNMTDGSKYDGVSDADMPDVVSALNSHIEANGSGIPEITLVVSSNCSRNDGTKYISKTYVSYIAIELECEYTAGLNIHRKVNDNWVQAQAAYQKQNGSWVEITEDECKAILQSNGIK